MRFIKLVYLFLITLGFGCGSSSNFPKEPELTFISLSKSTMNQSALGPDFIFVTLEFTDGDGDIGSDTEINLEVIDNRTGDNYDFFKVPTIPEPGANNGKEPSNPAIICDEVMVPENTFTLGINLTDRAGNKSNTVTTSPITLICSN